MSWCAKFISKSVGDEILIEQWMCEDNSLMGYDVGLISGGCCGHIAIIREVEHHIDTRECYVVECECGNTWYVPIDAYTSQQTSQAQRS